MKLYKFLLEEGRNKTMGLAKDKHSETPESESNAMARGEEALALSEMRTEKADATKKQTSQDRPAAIGFGWISSKEVMQLLRISERTLRNWTSKGILGYSKLSGNLYFKRSEIDELLQNRYQKLAARC